MQGGDEGGVYDHNEMEKEYIDDSQSLTETDSVRCDDIVFQGERKGVVTCGTYNPVDGSYVIHVTKGNFRLKLSSRLPQDLRDDQFEILKTKEHGIRTTSGKKIVCCVSL